MKGSFSTAASTQMSRSVEEEEVSLSALHSEKVEGRRGTWGFRLWTDQ